LFFEKGALKKEIAQLSTIEYFSKQFSERIPDHNFREFLEGFLRWDPKERITPVEALKDKWISEGMPENIKFGEFLARQEEKESGCKTGRIIKSKSKEKKQKLSFSNLHKKSREPKRL
jgi:serine/threonine protein kinase